MDKDIIKLVKTFAKQSKSIVDYKAIFLYGSYARGNARPDSDIDVAVLVDDIQDNYLEISSKLFSLVWDIDTRIEPVLLSEKNDKSGFIESIKSYGYKIA